ncbi:MAG: hypothetical protein R8M14_09455 [Ghiorsea sp.]
MKYFLTLAMVLMPLYAWAAPDVKINITAEKVMLVEENGKQVEVRKTATEVKPGDILVYTLHYENKGDEVAKGVKLVDPIPETTTYLVGSVFGPGSEMAFSIDDGKKFNAPSLLTYSVSVGGKNVDVEASPEQYSHIQWSVKAIAPGKSGVAGFRVRVK